MKIIASLSGGMDSATMLGYYINIGHQVKAFSFFYGSKHNKYELEAAKKLAAFYNIEHYLFDLSPIFSQIQSNLLLTGKDIPEGHYNDATMSQTVVPGRNHIFAAILAGIAESNKYDAIALAVHQGDHHIYPDCRLEFIEALCQSIELQSENKVTLLTPFINFDKEGILNIGHDVYPEVPYQFTRTCYKDQPVSCGLCGSCTERLEAWNNIGKTDPIVYEGEIK